MFIFFCVCVNFDYGSFVLENFSAGTEISFSNGYFYIPNQGITVNVINRCKSMSLTFLSVKKFETLK